MRASRQEDTEDLEFAKALQASFKEAKKKEDEEGRQGPEGFMKTHWFPLIRPAIKAMLKNVPEILQVKKRETKFFIIPK